MIIENIDSRKTRCLIIIYRTLRENGGFDER